MVLEAQLVIRHAGCYTEHVQGNARVVHLTAGPEWSVLVITAETPGELETIVAAFARVNGRPFEVLERSPLTCVLRFTSSDTSIVRVIFGAGASIVWPAIFRDGTEHYTILARSKRDLARIVEALEGRAEVRVQSCVEVATDAISASVPSADLLADLTEKQLGILLLAVKRGYYRTPRRAETADLAQELGVTASTVAEHLRKAGARILARVAEAIEDQPAMRKAASRGRGRPPAAKARRRR